MAILPCPCVVEQFREDFETLFGRQVPVVLAVGAFGFLEVAELAHGRIHLLIIPDSLAAKNRRKLISGGGSTFSRAAAS
jgi:hypothetical protein